MAKDPAFLFYTQDFLTGTIFMTDEEVGKYIRLLCAQHQHGGLIDKTSFRVTVGNSKLLKEKFIETEDGFYNNRLMVEMVKRERKSTNLSANARKRWDMQKQCNSNATAMPTEDEDENENKDIKEVIDYLNDKSGKKFNYKTKATIKHIHARFSEGRTVGDFKKVIDVKCKKWLTDPKMADYLRPETLFGGKFEAYLNEDVAKKPQSNYFEPVNCPKCKKRIVLKGDLTPDGGCIYCEVEK